MVSLNDLWHYPTQLIASPKDLFLQHFISHGIKGFIIDIKDCRILKGCDIKTCANDYFRYSIVNCIG